MTDFEYEPFDLEKALANPERIVCRDGTQYKFGAYNPNAGLGCAIVGWRVGRFTSHYSNGKFLNDVENFRDLVLLPEHTEVTLPERWERVYQYKDGGLISSIWISQEEPTTYTGMKQIACIHHPETKVKVKK